MSNLEFTKILLLKMHGLLKPLGYVKKGLIFQRDYPQIVHLIGLQKSRDNTAQAIKVTVNLAVWLKSLTPIRAGRTDNPTVWEAHWQYRIGQLLPEKSDKWWWVTNDEEAQLTAQEICSELNKFALPKLAEIQTENDLVSLWRNGICTGLTDFGRKNYLSKIDSR